MIAHKFIIRNSQYAETVYRIYHLSTSFLNGDIRRSTDFRTRLRMADGDGG